MIANKKEFTGGIAMMAGFLAVLIIIFLPLSHGKNGLNLLDDLFNSISKGSAYYIPDVKEKVVKSESGKNISLSLSFETEEQTAESAALFIKAGATAVAEGKNLKIAGDLGKILAACLDDSDALFHNQGEKLQEKYGMDGKKVLFNWWTSLKASQKALNKQEKFDEAKTIYTVMTRAVECSYNYYKVEAQSMSDKVGMVIFALVFYVIYTLWYGYAILFIFEGWGLQISH